jgi:hypothetical protein
MLVVKADYVIILFQVLKSAWLRYMDNDKVSN